MEHMLIHAGSGTGNVNTTGASPADRLKALHAVAAELQSIGTTVSRLPQFPRRFTEAVLRGVRRRPGDAV